MTKDTKKEFLIIAIICIILSAFFYLAETFLKAHGYDVSFLLFSNIFLFFITVGSFLYQQKGLQSPNPNVFVRSVYASMIFKMFICMFAVLIYVFLFRNKMNRSGIFTAMSMYIIYTVAEVSALMKAARKKTNA